MIEEMDTQTGAAKSVEAATQRTVPWTLWLVSTAFWLVAIFALVVFGGAVTADSGSATTILALPVTYAVYVVWVQLMLHWPVDAPRLSLYAALTSPHGAVSATDSCCASNSSGNGSDNGSGNDSNDGQLGGRSCRRALVAGFVVLPVASREQQR